MMHERRFRRAAREWRWGEGRCEGRVRKGFQEVKKSGSTLWSEAACGRQALVVWRNQVYSEEGADQRHLISPPRPLEANLYFFS